MQQCSATSMILHFQMSFLQYSAWQALCCNTVPHGLTARISGFHPGGPGSTPGVGKEIIFDLWNFDTPFANCEGRV